MKLFRNLRILSCFFICSAIKNHERHVKLTFDPITSIQDDYLTHKDNFQSLEIISVGNSVQNSRIEKETFNGVQNSRIEKEIINGIQNSRIEKKIFNNEEKYYDSEQCSPSDDCRFMWRSASIISSLIFAIFLALIKLTFESAKTNTDAIEIRQLHKNNMMLNSRVVELEDLNRREKILNVALKDQSAALQETCDEEFASKQIGLKEMADVKTSLDRCITELEEQTAKADVVQMQHLALRASSDRSYKDKFDDFQTVINSLNKKVTDENAVFIGLNMKIRELSETLKENVGKYSVTLKENLHKNHSCVLELEKTGSKGCSNVVALRDKKCLLVAVNEISNLLADKITATRKEKDQLIGKINKLETELLTMESEKMKKKEKDFVLSTVIRIERDQYTTSKVMMENRILELETSGKIQRAQSDQLKHNLDQYNVTKTALEAIIQNLESQSIDKGKIMLTIKGRSAELESSIDKMVIEKNISNDRIVMLEGQKKEDKAKLNEMAEDKDSLKSRMKDLEEQSAKVEGVATTLRAQVCTMQIDFDKMETEEKRTKSHHFEELTLRKTESEYQIIKNEARLATSLAENDQLAARIATLEENEIKTNNRIGQFEKEKSAERHVRDQNDLYLQKILDQNAILEAGMATLQGRLRELKAQRSTNAYFLSAKAIRESDLEIAAFQRGIDALTGSPSPVPMRGRGSFNHEISSMKAYDENATEEVEMSFFASVAGVDDCYSEIAISSDDGDDPDICLKMFRDVDSISSYDDDSIENSNLSFEFFTEVKRESKELQVVRNEEVEVMEHVSLLHESVDCKELIVKNTFKPSPRKNQALRNLTISECESREIQKKNTLSVVGNSLRDDKKRDTVYI